MGSIKKECRKDGNCVAVDIRFTASNYYVNYENRTAESLKKTIYQCKIFVVNLYNLIFKI